MPRGFHRKPKEGRVDRDSLGLNLGGAMADALKPLGYATKPVGQSGYYEDAVREDEDGLIPSDRFVQALGDSLEARGYRRL